MRKLLVLLFPFFSIAFFISCRKYADVKNETIYSEFSFQDQDRSYLIHIPKNYDPTKEYPLIFVLHGISSRAKAIAGFSGFTEQSDLKDFIVCYPQGYKRSWGMHIPIGPAPKKGIDDIGFIDHLIDTLTTNYSIDTNKIFACGISNGGFMSVDLACELPNRISGIALVCSNMFAPISAYSKNDNPVPFLVIGGVDDPMLAFEGGEIMMKNKYSSIGYEAAVEYWVERNNCLPPKDSVIIENIADDKTTVIKYYSSEDKSENKVVFYKVIGGGHAWPGRGKDFKSVFIGKISAEIKASEVITDFFLKLDD